MSIPYFPSTYNIVLTVSTGVKNILNKAAIVEALSVFIDMLRSLVILLWLRISNVNLFEKVSPNLDKGPYTKATE